MYRQHGPHSFETSGSFSRRAVAFKQWLGSLSQRWACLLWGPCCTCGTCLLCGGAFVYILCQAGVACVDVYLLWMWCGACGNVHALYKLYMWRTCYACVDVVVQQVCAGCVARRVAHYRIWASEVCSPLVALLIPLLAPKGGVNV